jgi:hypothetical protein
VVGDSWDDERIVEELEIPTMDASGVLSRESPPVDEPTHTAPADVNPWTGTALPEDE